MTFHILVPLNSAFGIAPGSGIVAVAEGDGSFRIDFEGNLYGAANLQSIEERLYHAASRSEVRYPTIARIHLPEAVLNDSFLDVGRYDHAEAKRLKTQYRDAVRDFHRRPIPLTPPGPASDTDCVRRSIVLFPETKEAWAEWTAHSA